MGESGRGRYARFVRALRDFAPPVAAVDLDAFDRNTDTLVAPVRAAGKTLRFATKSIRCVALIRRAMERAGSAAKGVMAFSAQEAKALADDGFDDVLVAYPTAHPADAKAIAEANRRAKVAIVVDDEAHVGAMERAARDAGVVVPLVIDLDAAYRGAGLRLGVKRSPLADPERIAAFAERIAKSDAVRFAGCMAYEAQIAGLPDHAFGGAARVVKALSRPYVAKLRDDATRAIRARGLALDLFNGGGTGSVAWSSADPSLTEVTVGSGLLDSHLFDRSGVDLVPAAFFALQVVRLPADGVVTCSFGGYVASGAAGVDRLPKPWLPEGLSLTWSEGAGEVQTPLEGVRDLTIGDLVLFRHAKAGELAERFAEYRLIRGDAVVDTVPTYRGKGWCFG